MVTLWEPRISCIPLAAKTDWVTVYTYGTYYPDPSIWLQNQAGTNVYEALMSGDPQGTHWTDQLGGMKYRTACGGVQIYNVNSRWVSWNYIGCY
jgi:hypothetical protein